MVDIEQRFGLLSGKILANKGKQLNKCDSSLSNCVIRSILNNTQLVETVVYCLLSLRVVFGFNLDLSLDVI